MILADISNNIANNSDTCWAFIGIGSNLGNCKDNIDKAVRMLGDIDDTFVTGMSSVYETTPLGTTGQANYFNAVVRVRTTLEPSELYKQMAAIEDALGRVRSEKWSARTIDLDLLLYGDRIIESPRITVPHKQMHLRNFVLRGLCELDGNTVHPMIGKTCKELANRLNGQDFILDQNTPQLVCIAGVIGAGKTTLGNKLAELFRCDLICEAYDTNPYLPKVYAGNTDLAIDSQLFFLNSRVEQLSLDKLSASQLAVSDYVFAKDKLFAQRTLNAEQFDRYQQQHSEIKKDLAKPVVVVHLHGSADLVLERISKRNRPYEKGITLETIESLAADYDRLFENWNQCPLFRVSIDEFDCMDQAKVNSFAKEIKSYLWKQ